MAIAKRSRLQFAIVAVCVLAALLAGCSRDPNIRKQKYLESGQRYFDKGQYREAAIQFENAIQVDSRFADAHYKLALAAMKLQQWPIAFQELSTTLQIQPDQYAAHLDLANLLILSRQFNDAKQHLETLKDKQPNNPDVYIAWSNYDAGMNDTTAALADMQKALQLDPSRSESYLNLAMIQMRGQQWDAAEANFKKAVELSPKSTNSLVLLGDFYQTRGRFPEAEEMFRRAIATAADDPNPRLSLASLYIAENKPSQAEEFLRQSKKDFPNNSMGYRMLGDFYFSSNQLDKATAEYASLYRDHAKDMVVKKNYIQLLILKDRLDDARKLNDEVVKAQPDDQDAQVYKGEIEIRSGKASDAVNTLQAVLKNDPDNAVAHYQQGRGAARQVPCGPHALRVPYEPVTALLARDGAGAFFAGARFAGAFFAGPLRARAFFAGARFAGAFFAGERLTGAFFAGERFTAAFFAPTRFAPAFFTPARFAPAFFAPAFFAPAFFAAGAFATTTIGRARDPRPLRSSLSLTPGVKPMPFDALMRTAAPVWGLRPRRACRSRNLNVPNPADHGTPDRHPLVHTSYTTASSAASDCWRFSPVSLLIASMSSVLFTNTSMSWCRSPRHTRGSAAKLQASYRRGSFVNETAQGNGGFGSDRRQVTESTS